MPSTRLFPLFVAACLSISASFAAVPIPKPPAIDAPAYVLVDFHSGRVLAASQADAQREPASITKLMTAYIAFVALREKRLSLTEEVLVSENAWRTGGSASGGSTTFLEVKRERSQHARSVPAGHPRGAARPRWSSPRGAVRPSPRGS